MRNREMKLAAALVATLGTLGTLGAANAAGAAESRPCIGFSADGRTAWYVSNSCVSRPKAEGALIQLLKVDLATNTSTVVRTIAEEAKGKEACEKATAALRSQTLTIADIAREQQLVACQSWEQATPWQLLAAPRGRRDVADAVMLATRRGLNLDADLGAIAALDVGLRAAGYREAAEWMVTSLAVPPGRGEDDRHHLQHARLRAELWKRERAAKSPSSAVLEHHVSELTASIQALPFARRGKFPPELLDYLALAEGVRLYYVVGETKRAAKLAKRAFKLLRKKGGNGSDYAAIVRSLIIGDNVPQARAVLRAIRGDWPKLEGWLAAAEGYTIVGDGKAARDALAKAASAAEKLKERASPTAWIEVARAFLHVGQRDGAIEWLEAGGAPADLAAWWADAATKATEQVVLPAPKKMARGLEALENETSAVLAAEVEALLGDTLCAQGRAADAMAMSEEVHGFVDGRILVRAYGSALLRGERPDEKLSRDLAVERE